MIKPGTVVRFLPKMEDNEVELDAGMLARFVSMTPKTPDGVVAVVFDTSDFIEHNNAAMKPTYYDEDGVPCLTAREANCWPASEKHNIYLMEEDWMDNFEIVDSLDGLRFATNIRDALESFKRYINRYDTDQVGIDNYQPQTWVDDLTYAIGLSLDPKRFKWASGHRKFEELLLEHLTIKHATR